MIRKNQPGVNGWKLGSLAICVKRSDKRRTAHCSWFSQGIRRHRWRSPHNSSRRCLHDHTRQRL